MEDSNIKFTRAYKEYLLKDKDGDPCYETWNYRSIVDILLYLAGISRLDIVYALHQCAIFSCDAKHNHKVGVKHITHYLKVKREKGTTMTPNMNNLSLELFADDDFKGLWASEHINYPIGVMNKSDLLLNFGGVPIFWSSKLQT